LRSQPPALVDTLLVQNILTTQPLESARLESRFMRTCMSASSTKHIPTEAQTEQAEPRAATNPAKAEPAAIKCDSSRTTACYANFCRVTGTPEELIIDFGLNTQPMGVPADPIEISERIVMNYYTAKRMMAALQMSLQRHEAAFGKLETDVQKRVVPNLQPQVPR